MRILLTAAENINVFSKGSAKAYPKLGLLYLAAFLRNHVKRRGELEFRYHDMLLENLSFDDMGKIVREWKPDVVCISCLSYSMDAFHELAGRVKNVNQAILVVGGGPYVSSLREKVLDDRNVNILVFNEGEVTFLELVECLLEGRSFHDVQGIAYRAKGQVCSTAPRALIDDLDSLPIPAFDMIDFDAYSRFNPHLDFAGRFAPIVTSRGCPFKCVYCHALHGKAARFRSADHVMTEIEYLHKECGVDLFYIYDDIFNLDRPRAKEICRRIVESRMDIAIDFLNGLRADQMDYELVDLMLDAGAYYFAYAIETATPRLQDVIRKYNKLDVVADIIDYTVRQGRGRCIVATYNMIGFPSETEDEVWNTIEFNKSLTHQIADVAIAIPQENTEMYDMALASGFKQPDKRTPNYGKDVSMSASEKISPARLSELLGIFKRSFFDEDRRLELHRLAHIVPESAQKRYLGGFLRGYINISKDVVGDVNAALYTGMGSN